jgi:hypothetical protein
MPELGWRVEFVGFLIDGHGLKGYGPKGDFFLFSCSMVTNNHNFFLLTFQIMAFKISSFKITKTWLNY